MLMKDCLGRGLFAVLLAVLGSPGTAETTCTLGAAPYVQTVPDGGQVTVYSAPSVPKGASCDAVAVKATCQAGALNGAGAARFAGCMPLEGFTGLNLNGTPQLLDPRMLDATGAHWVRVFIDILRAKADIDAGKATTALNPSNWKVLRAAADSGRAKTIISLKWDFRTPGLHPPLPDSAEEAALFAFMDSQILDPLAASTTIIVSGNEPYVNADIGDWKPNPAYGGRPVVIFYERVTAHINDYLIKRDLRAKVKLFVGAFTRLDAAGMQTQPAVTQLLDFAERAPFVDGVDVHIHVVNLDHMKAALDFVQSLTAKPLLVSEYTYVFGMRNALEARAQINPEFSQKWKVPSGKTESDFLRCDVFHRGPDCKTLPTIAKPEWDAFVQSRPWFIDHFLLKSDAIFKAHDVLGATFGLVQNNPSPADLQPDGTPWYLGFLYSPAALGHQADGMPMPNYQYLDDFRQLTRQAN
ncbi:MAG: hypothetical protein ACOH2H_08530 [Cypionkella sp.]